MTSATIIKESVKKIVTSYSLWTIGLTIDPARREGEIGNPFGWRLFEADTEQDAQNVEAHFVGKGMKSDTGEHAYQAKYVFIFMETAGLLPGDSHQNNESGKPLHIQWESCYR